MGNNADYHNVLQFSYYGRDITVKHICMDKPIIKNLSAYLKPTKGHKNTVWWQTRRL